MEMEGDVEREEGREEERRIGVSAALRSLRSPATT